jgi:hypothetical protein
MVTEGVVAGGVAGALSLLLPQAARIAAPAAMAVRLRCFVVTTFRRLGMMVPYWFARMLRIELLHRPHADERGAFLQANMTVL